MIAKRCEDGGLCEGCDVCQRMSDEEVLEMWRRGELVVRTERDQAVEYAAELHAWLVDEANGRPSLNYPDSPMNGWPNGWKW